MIIQNVAYFTEQKTFAIGDIGIRDGLITAPNEAVNDEIIDGHGAYLIPGLIDLHTHGCVGEDASDGSAEGLRKMARYQASRGVTGFCPTTMSLMPDELSQVVQVIEEVASAEAQILGIHLEGPYLNPNRKGAQKREALRLPDVKEIRHLQHLAKGKICYLDLAPELPGAMELIRALSSELILSLAHTEADYACAKQAFGAGVHHVTHLFNAMPDLLHREPGLIAAAAEADDVFAELICDGLHVHPAMIRLAFQLFGEDRMILISDSMRATGMPDGIYTLGGQEVIVREQEARLTDGTLAGSVADLMTCLQRCVKEFDIPLTAAVTAASMNPAKELGIFDRIGSVTIGKSANLVLLSGDLTVQRVILQSAY
ncbi:MAG: N-acetylglucosamine-6-phosphate deacetylase [Lachnospiraceae bacterium]|nr:N-acetylglucosamine-6-phosphate deacetylase [Lachnospiraceae bacterium]